MKRLSRDDRQRLIEMLIDDDIASIRNDGASSVRGIFENGIVGYANMPDDVLLELASEGVRGLDIGGIEVIEDPSPEKEYRVLWEIDVSAPSPRDAALRARYFQRPDSSACVFDVRDPDSEPGQDEYIRVDLEESPASGHRP